MKLFGKRTDTNTSAKTASASKVVVGGKGIKNGLPQRPFSSVINKKSLIALAVILSLVLVGAGVLSYSKYQANRNRTTKVENQKSSANEAVQNNDIPKAIEHAREALKQDPNNLDNIQLLANLTSYENPSESKQLYARALEELKKQDDPDVDGKRAAVYWAAAEFAYRADLVDKSKQYYQKVIAAADSASERDQDLAKQAKAMLEKLK